MNIIVQGLKRHLMISDGDHCLTFLFFSLGRHPSGFLKILKNLKF